MKRAWLGGVIATALLIAGCRSVYYSAWEKLGKEKRDLLETKVTQVRDEQQEATQQLKDALTRLQELYGFQGGELEKFYRGLQKDYERSAGQAETVRNRIKQMDQVAQDLFREWETEMQSITSPALRQDSQTKLQQTRQRYGDLYSAVTRAERGMEPVLSKFHDYVLYLKHNLNAQAIGALQNEASSIQQAINQLIKDMNDSIRKADEFIKTVP